MKSCLRPIPSEFAAIAWRMKAGCGISRKWSDLHIHEECCFGAAVATAAGRPDNLGGSVEVGDESDSCLQVDEVVQCGLIFSVLVNLFRPAPNRAGQAGHQRFDA
jgi:hypothetical protein